MNAPTPTSAHLKFRAVSSDKRTPARTDEDKLKKLKHWKSLADYGGIKLARKRTGLETRLAKAWAAELNFDLGRHA